MVTGKNIRFIFLFLTVIYTIGLYFFYLRYVPLVRPFQAALVPIIFVAFILTTVNVQWGILFFIFSFPLINNLPYFFGIAEPLPHAPTALVLFLFFFLGWLIHNSFSKQDLSFKHNIFKPLIILSILILFSGIITFFRYANFFPFLSDSVYELVTSVYGVTAGGAIMSTIFFSLNYLTGFALFFILLNSVRSEKYIKKLLLVLCFSSLLALSFGLFQSLKNMKLGNNPISIGGGLINATFKDALSFGAYIAFIVPLIMGVLFYFKWKEKILSFIVIILSFYMILLTGSKSGFLCLLFSVFIFLTFSMIIIFDLLKSRAISLKSIVFLLLSLIFLISTIIFINANFKEKIIQSRTFTRIIPTVEGGIKGFLSSGRFLLWKMGAYMVADYPLTGVGIGGYIIESANYAEKYHTPIGVPESAENYFLQAGSELGIIGITLVLWIFWEIIKQMKRSYLRIPSTDKKKFILIGAIAGVISYFINIQTHSYIGSYEIKYTFWLLVALIFALGRGERNDEEEKVHFKRNFKIISATTIIVFSAIHLWNSTHSLSLANQTEEFNLKQDFGFYQLEQTKDGREFRWTRGYGGLTIKVENPVLEIALLASHPDIYQNPVKVKIYIVKDFFKKKRLLDEITLTQNIWKIYEYDIREEVGEEVILLFKVSRTWNPLRVHGTPDPRNLGVAVGRIEFKEKTG